MDSGFDDKEQEMRRMIMYALLGGVFFIMAGCAGGGKATAPGGDVSASSPSPRVMGDQSNLVDVGYHTADTLLKNLTTRINPAQPVVVGSFVNVKRVEQSTNFGRMLSDIVASRLAQKGYAVLDLRLRDGTVLITEETDYVASEEMGYITEETDYITNEVGYVSSGPGYMTEKSGEFVLSRKTRQEAISHNAQAIVVGTYARAQGDVYVSARMLHAVTGKIISSFDFRVPLSLPLRAMFHSPYW